MEGGREGGKEDVPFPSPQHREDVVIAVVVEGGKEIGREGGREGGRTYRFPPPQHS